MLPASPSHSQQHKSPHTATSHAWFIDVVRTLDMGLSLSGAPGRSAVFEAFFQQLHSYIDGETFEGTPSRWSVSRPVPLETNRRIPRAEQALSFPTFQGHLDVVATPLIIPGAITEWPASQRWHDPNYLLSMTLGGRRVVPVEVGKSYTDDDWSQTIMPFGDFMSKYLLPRNTPEIGYEIGYLAQHDLFAQIPALKADIMIPDYCYTTPPDPDSDAAVSRTSGLTSRPQLDEPLLNAWLGPKGTKTPLHTDPYHNILCQVVGYKYVRLYSPKETPNLYPHGVDEKGISMDNTSQVDICFHSRTTESPADRDATIRETQMKFPLFQKANYMDAILGPGDCVYIPLGWWHYVESLSTSFSVSFWWN